MLNMSFVIKIFALFFLVSLCYSNSIKLHKIDHKFKKIDIEDYYNFHISSHKSYRALSSVPMGGGLLTLGTYIANVTVGTPGKEFGVIIDTGSSNFALPSIGCEDCKTQNLFNPSSSSSFTGMPCNSADCQKCTPSTTSCTDCSVFFGDSYCSTNQPSNCGFGITYGGGSSALGGYYGYDELCLGDVCSNVTVGMIQTETPAGSFNAGPTAAGILGLASPYNACNPSCVEVVFESLVNNNKDLDNVFGVCITEENGGQLDLGYINQTRVSTPLEYVPMTFDRWYNIGLKDIQIGSNSINIPKYLYTTTNDVIGSFVDTGTSVLILGPASFDNFQSTFQEHYSNLPGVTGAGFFSSVGCITHQHMGNNLNNFPDVTMVFKGENGKDVSIPIKPSTYLLDVGDLYCLGIVPTPSIGAVLGDVFMMNYYIVFDRENLRLGFSPLTDDSFCT
eukprot:TRINITY_DN9359_c0_g1_i1.p1 TRINITY_DN9359_c0_g1~~TRINITY_DN9359_c0_g1_i1.p1  ORF type:complete len:448 (+),score=160.76 TRINITY_DN9359_c0_g1_i1:29-1372(+)